MDDTNMKHGEGEENRMSMNNSQMLVYGNDNPIELYTNPEQTIPRIDLVKIKN